MSSGNLGNCLVSVGQVIAPALFSAFPLRKHLSSQLFLTIDKGRARVLLHRKKIQLYCAESLPQNNEMKSQ